VGYAQGEIINGEMHQRVEAACEHQRGRFEDTDITSNTDMPPRQIRIYCALDDTCQALQSLPRMDLMQLDFLSLFKTFSA
jgi:predicted ATPase with chaperone activity